MKSIMDSLGVVEDKIIHKFAVEFIRIQKKKRMVVNELFLNSAIESFYMGVHLRAFRIGVVMGKMKLSQLFSKVFFEFRTIIS